MAVCLFSSALPFGASAQVVTPEIDRGLTWLQSQVQADLTVVNESVALAERSQVRCEVRSTLTAYSKNNRLPNCPSNVTQTEILARSVNSVPVSYWMADGGAAPDVGYDASSVLDTAWALGTQGVTTTQSQAAIAYLFHYQAVSGGFAASRLGPETVAATGFIGRQLSLQGKLFAGDQSTELARAVSWVNSQAQAPGRWSSLYETALAHLFLVLESPDPARDAATYEYFVANQQADGSWLDDPYLTALVLRAAGERSLPKTSDTGVRFRIIDAVSRTPISGANASSNSGSPLSDANGMVTILGAPPGSLSISINKAGYQSKSVIAVITAGAVTDLGDVELQPLANQVLVSGDIINGSTLQPVPSVAVNITVNGVFTRSLLSDVNGHFETAMTNVGRYHIEFVKPGFISGIAEFDAAAGNQYQVDTRLTPTSGISDGALLGVVTDAATRLPISGVMVQWQSVTSATVFTATDGSYSMPNLIRQPGTLSFSRSGYLGKTVSGIVPGNPPTAFNIALDKALTPTTGTVSGTTKDASGAILAGVRVELIDAATNASVAVLTSDAAGQFIQANLAFKTYKFTAGLAGYATLSGQFALNTLTPLVNLDLLLQPAVGSISGKVVDKVTGSPIAAATVDAGTARVQTDAAGIFTLSNLAAGNYTLSVSAAGYRSTTLPVTAVTGHLTDIGNVGLVANTGSLAELFGTVKSKAGAPIAAATVSVMQGTLGTATDTTGTFQLSNIPLGDQQIRVVAPGYQPATYNMALTDAIRYRLDAVLTPVDANAVTISATTDSASYGAYASGQVTTRFTVSSGVSQVAYLEFAVFDTAGRFVKALPEPGNNMLVQVGLAPAAAPNVMPFTTGNLAPGTYRVEVSLYDSQSLAGNTSRALLAQTNTSFTIVSTRKFEAMTVIPLPAFANVGVPTAAGYHVEIKNKSNVAVDFDLALRLDGPGGVPVGALAPHISIRPDETFKSLDVSMGTIAFNPPGLYPAVASVTGVDPPPIATRVLTVVPATRMEVQQTLQPAVIPPGADQKIRVDIRLKGVGQ